MNQNENINTRPHYSSFDDGGALNS